MKLGLEELQRVGLELVKSERGQFDDVLVPGSALAQSVTIDDFDPYATGSELRMVWSFPENGSPTLSSPGELPTENMRLFGTQVAGGSSVETGRALSSIQFAQGTFSFLYFLVDADNDPAVSNIDITVRIESGGGAQSCDVFQIAPSSFGTPVTFSQTVPGSCNQVDLTAITAIRYILSNGSAQAGDMSIHIDNIVITGAVPVELQSFTVE